MRHEQSHLSDHSFGKAHHVRLEYADGTNIRVDGSMPADDLPKIARAADAKAHGTAYKADAFGFIVSIVELIGL